MSAVASTRQPAVVPNGTAPASLAVYLRVSSEEQAIAGTIATQRDAAQRYLAYQDVIPFGWYEDNGVSGVVPFASRPEGGRLMADARAGHVKTVLVWRLDRFGRNNWSIYQALHALEELGVRLVSVTEQFDTKTPAGAAMLGMLATFAQFERDSIGQRATEGIGRHLREGGWCGGQVPYGYVVTGTDKDARLAISHALLDGLGMSEAQVVELLYHLATTARWSLVKIADHLTALGVPTATRWRANRVHAILTNPVYKGLATYGKRGKATRTSDLPTVPCPAIVTPEVWQAAQDALQARQRFATRHATHDYGLRGLVTCGACGHVLHGALYPLGKDGKTGRYYVCGAKSHAVTLYGNAEAEAHRCPSTAVRADWLEDRIWQDVEGYLRDPGPVLDALATKMDAHVASAISVRASVAQAERALAAKAGEQDTVLTLYRQGRIDSAALNRQLDAIQREEATLREQLAVAQSQAQQVRERDERLRGAGALLRRLQVRLDEPMTPALRRELIEGLVDTINVGVEDAGVSRRGLPKKRAVVTVVYRFDEPGATLCIPSGTKARAGCQGSLGAGVDRRRCAGRRGRRAGS